MRVTAAFFLAINAVSAAVLAVDYGTEWTKAALVKPGIPLEIVLTKDTKRKEQSVVAFKGQERLYGGDAANMAARDPSNTFPGLKDLLGQQYGSQAALDYAKLYPAIKMRRSEHDSISFEVDSETMTVEELVAMELINIRKNAEVMANEAVKDAILTVPPYFVQAQRLALSQAAKLAGLKVVEVLSDGVAVALDYGKARTFTEPQTHIIFDMGAGSTSATVVKFSTLSVKDVGRFNKTVTDIEVLGTGFSSEISGNAMTERLYDHLLQQFDNLKGSQTQAPLAGNARATARLLKEATRIKQVLSANNEAVVSLESLHEDIDFRYKVARTEFEDITADLAPLTSRPILDALAMAGITASGIDSLILHGGAARVPFVQKALLQLVSEDQIARNVNADEAAVMGAVFRGAALSGSFRVKEMIIRDTTAYDSQYSLDGISQSLFAKGTPVGTVKNVTIPPDVDSARLIISYTQSASSPPISLLEVQLADTTVASSSLIKEFSCKSSATVVSLKLIHSGMVAVSDTFVSCDTDQRPGMAEKVKGWFGAKESTTETLQEESQDGDAAESQIRVVTKYKPLNHTITYLDLPAMPRTEYTASAQRIKTFEKADHDRIARETARNGLEAFIYKVRDLLESETFVEVSTDTEQLELADLAAKANDWMYEDGETAPMTELVAKKRGMSILVDKINLRRSELATRDEKIAALQKQISSSRSFIKSQLKQIEEFAEKKSLLEAARTSESPAAEKIEVEVDDASETENTISGNDTLDDLFEPFYTRDDLTSLEKKVDEVESWLSGKAIEQKKLLKNQDPVLMSSDLVTKAKKIQDDLMSMLGKATYKQQAKPKTKSKVRASKTKSGSRAKATFKASGTAAAADKENDVLQDDPAAPVEQNSPAANVVQEEVVDDSLPADPAPGSSTTPELDIKDEL